MSVILLAVGIVVAAAGVASTGFGIAISELPLRSPLLIAGTTALTGGLILIGLSAVITELGRVADGLRGRPAPRPAARPAETHDAIIQPAPVLADAVPMAAAPQTAFPVPASPPLPPRTRPELPLREPVPAEPYAAQAPSAVEVSAAAIERLRSSIPRAERPTARGEASVVTDIDAAPLSPDGTPPPVAPNPRPASVEPAAVEPKEAAEDRPSGSAVDALKASRLDFLFRSRPRPAPPAQLESFDAVWPADGGPVSQASERETQPRPDQIPRQTSAAARASEPLPDEQSRKREILKSGVVDGMAYTLYADGSIEAKLPHGTVRFGSIADLRAHIESNS
jgi:hypothetical protein